MFQLHLPVLQTASEQFLAVRGLLELDLAQLLADLVLCLCSYDEVHPVR